MLIQQQSRHKLHDLGIAHQIGRYSDAVEVHGKARWLFTSGTPGLGSHGELPANIKKQAEMAWQHILDLLDLAGMGVGDIVKVTQFLTRGEDVAGYAKVRARFLGAVEPASMLLVIPQLVRPEFLVEIEVIAATSADG